MTTGIDCIERCGESPRYHLCTLREGHEGDHLFTCKVKFKGNAAKNSTGQTGLAVKDSTEKAAPAFTKGPWKVQRNARLEIVSSVEPYEGCGWGQAVAHVYRAGKMNGTPYRMPAEANARLMAAAPSLYAALKRANVLVNFLTVRQVIEAGDEAIEAAGLNPYCMNEGLAEGDEPIAVDFARAALDLVDDK